MCKKGEWDLLIGRLVALIDHNLYFGRSASVDDQNNVVFRWWENKTSHWMAIGDAEAEAEE